MMKPAPSAAPSSVYLEVPLATPAVRNDAVVVRRPHFQLKGDSLFFLISRRPFAALTEAEQTLWDALEEGPSFAALQERLGPSAEEGVRRLLALGVAEVIPPAPPGRRRRIMVVEPHMDDAALSVGGLMLQRREDCEFIIVTLATRSVASSYRGMDREFFDIETISAIRKAESDLVARLLWGRHIGLGLVEASLRYHPQNWTLDWFRRHEYAIYEAIEHAPGREDLEEWTATLAAAIADLKPEEIWMPLGVGMHADHQLTRHACLNVLRADPELVKQCVCRFYQDVPYAGDHRAHTAALVKAFEDAGAKLEEERVDITAVMPEKRRLLSVYSSQWKINVIQLRVEACARAIGAPGGYGELSYRLAAAPTEDIDMLATSAVKETVSHIARDVASWRRRNRSAASIALFLTAPAGRWPEDMRFLLRCFPIASFEAHMQAKFAAEAEMFTSHRVSVRVGGNRWRWILRDVVPRIIGRRTPMVIISGRQREKHGRWLARLGFLSDAVVVPTMSDFVLALQSAIHNDERPR